MIELIAQIMKREAKSLYYRQRTYNIFSDEFEALLTKQGGACAICRQPFTSRVNVDHDHETGSVRGLLCSSCNTGLGHIEKSGFLESAVAYLDAPPFGAVTSADVQAIRDRDRRVASAMVNLMEAL